jgi:hypothetical protein
LVRYWEGWIPNARKIDLTVRSSEQENSIPYEQPFGVIDGSSETILEYIPALKSAFCAFIDRFSDVVVAIQVFILKLRVDVMMDKF